jgi:D-methionine transport system substrate-binding protein
MGHILRSIVLCLLILTGCEKPKNENHIRIGVTAGPHAIIMEAVKKSLKNQGVTLDIIEFNDFNLPNRALQEGELDANSFQHMPYLTEQNQRLHLNLVSICNTVLMPLGVYSKKWERLQDIREGSTISIPNDPTNEGRSLHLLEVAGFIKLKEGVTNPTPKDVVENPKKIRLLEIDSPQLPRTLEDVDASVINTDWVMLSGLDPSLALLRESLESPYVNVIAVRQGDVHLPKLQALIKTYQSQEIKTFIEHTFKGAIIAAW